MATKKLPAPTATLATGTGPFRPSDIKGTICNPIYVGVAPYKQIVPDEDWIAAALVNIQKDGPEQFLVNMLFVLRESMQSAWRQQDEASVSK